jgi:hypothetical protein
MFNSFLDSFTGCYDALAATVVVSVICVLVESQVT